MNQNSVSASSPTSACVPATNPNPVSTLVDGSYGATWIAATWTRPLALTEYQQGLGYLDIPTGGARKEHVNSGWRVVLFVWGVA